MRERERGERGGREMVCMSVCSQIHGDVIFSFSSLDSGLYLDRPVKITETETF